MLQIQPFLCSVSSTSVAFATAGAAVVFVVSVSVVVVACGGGVADVAAVVSNSKLDANIPLSTFHYFLKCC
jgi:hypothetical protein